MKKRTVALFALICGWWSAWARESVCACADNETAVLIHGLGRTPLCMKRLAWTLKSEGYRVLNLSYPSTRLSVRDAAETCLAPLITRLEATNPDTTIHFVTHSLGGIVLRQYLTLTENRPAGIGRVVMLAPPNQGSELADRLRHRRWYRWTTGPAGQELGCGETSAPRRIGPVEAEVGIIAGDRSLNPWFSAVIPGPDDGKVSVKSAALEEMKEFMVVHRSHTWMMWSGEVNRAVASFLAHGKFKES